jgi:hypothetical protein
MGKRVTRISCWWIARGKEATRKRGVDNIRMDLVEVEWCDVDWLDRSGSG